MLRTRYGVFFSRICTLVCWFGFLGGMQCRLPTLTSDFIFIFFGGPLTCFSHRYYIQGTRYTTSVWQGCVRAPLLFNMFFTAVLRVAEKRFLADAAAMDSMVQLQRKKEKREKKSKPRAAKVDGRGEGEEEEAKRLW